MTDSLIGRRDRFAATHAERRIEISGREWGILDVGNSGPALLLLPGTLGRGDIFWQQIEALAMRARIIACSYPTSGSVVQWADDVAVLLDRCGITRASVLGSSLGGYVAQCFATRHGERCERLLAANTLVSVAGIKERPPYSSDLVAGPIEELRAGFGTGLRRWAETHPDQRELVDLLLAEVGGRIPEAELRMRLRALKEADDLEALAMPADKMCTVEAEDDPLIPPEMRASVRERLRPAVAYIFSWGGHFPYLARPREYNAILEEQLGLSGPTLWGEGRVRRA